MELSDYYPILIQVTAFSMGGLFCSLRIFLGNAADQRILRILPMNAVC